MRERYYKADKTHKRAVTGTGLGLSIVRSVIELHGGEYGVASAPGEGSVFWFSLKIDGNK
ncbi:MAG: ATP-binding protein [Oscillospiraceae bacterium]